MLNPYQTKTAKILKISDQVSGIKLFELGFDKMNFQLKMDEDSKINPGQFIILSLPGFGEAPFAPCNKQGGNLQLCIRAVGKLTNKLHSLKVGDKIGIRGPFGNGWPLVTSSKKNLLIVVGGLGLIPLRTLILGKNQFLGKGAKLQIFYGARHPDEMLFRNEFERWEKNGIDLQLSIDKMCEGWKGCVGVVTKLFDVASVVKDARAFICGPPVMYKFVLEKLKKHGFEDEDIYLSLERRMHCGIGVCQHCGVGSFYTCKHGPVFRYDQIKNVQGAI
jgi:sulfhydrogenase subunit gamma (sulfur reductase)